MFIIHTFQFYATLEKEYWTHDAVCFHVKLPAKKNTEARLKIPQKVLSIFQYHKIREKDCEKTPFLYRELLIISIYEKLASLKS